MTQVRDGVVIDRDSGTAVPNLKYDFEIVPTDAKFYLLISAENLNQEDLALISIGINELLSGNFYIGGKTTRGLGNCKLENLEVYCSDWTDSDQLKKYLLNNTLESKYEKIEDWVSFLSKNIDLLFK